MPVRPPPHITGAMNDAGAIDAFITHWRDTGGSELANTRSFINGLCDLLGVEKPRGGRADDDANDYVFERRVFQDNGDSTKSFGRIDAYKRAEMVADHVTASETRGRLPRFLSDRPRADAPRARSGS